MDVILLCPPRSCSQPTQETDIKETTDPLKQGLVGKPIRRPFLFLTPFTNIPKQAAGKRTKVRVL